MRKKFRSSFWGVLIGLNDEALKSADISAADMSAKADDQLKRIQWDISTMKVKMRLLIVLMDIIVTGSHNLDDNIINKFQKMSRFVDPNEDKDSMSLLCEQATPEATQEEDQSQDDGKGEKDKGMWKCPVCPNKPFKYEKSMLNHVSKFHAKPPLNETLDESCFNPGDTSSQDGSKKAGKRKKSGEGYDEEYRDATRARLDTVDEADTNLEVDDALLDMSINSGTNEVKPNGTQEVLNSMAAKMIKAEREMHKLDMNESGDPDDSLRRDEEKSVQKLEAELQNKDNLLHIRNAKLMEKEGDLEELREVLDQKERALLEADRKIKEQSDEIYRLRDKIDDEEEGPTREELKVAMEKADKTIANLQGRQANLVKELKVAKANLRKLEIDQRSFEKVQTAMEATVVNLLTPVVPTGTTIFSMFYNL